MSKDAARSSSWVREEWRLIVQLVSYIVLIAGAYFALRSDLALALYRLNTIENNHLVHLSAAVEKVSDKQDDFNTRLTQTNDLITNHINQK